MDLHIRRASSDDIDLLVPLLDAYREFYGQASNEGLAREFFAARMIKDESVVLLAVDRDQDEAGVGFVQLFASFDSVELAPIWILHDLFVAIGARRCGVGRRLMQAASEFCRTTDAVRIDLSTAIDNTRAQALYRALGYVRDEGFYHYCLEL